MEVGSADTSCSASTTGIRRRKRQAKQQNAKTADESKDLPLMPGKSAYLQDSFNALILGPPPPSSLWGHMKLTITSFILNFEAAK